MPTLVAFLKGSVDGKKAHVLDHTYPSPTMIMHRRRNKPPMSNHSRSILKCLLMSLLHRERMISSSSEAPCFLPSSIFKMAHDFRAILNYFSLPILQMAS